MIQANPSARRTIALAADLRAHPKESPTAGASLHGGHRGPLPCPGIPIARMPRTGGRPMRDALRMTQGMAANADPPVTSRG